MALDFNNRKWVTNNKQIELKEDVNSVDEFKIYSFLNNKELAEYIHYNKITNFNNIDESFITINNGTYLVNFCGNKSTDIICTLYLISYSEERRIQTDIIYLNSPKIVSINSDVKSVKICIRVQGYGEVDIKNINFKKCNSIDELKNKIIPKEVSKTSTENKYLILTNVYPSESKLYRNVFVHRRAKIYKENNIDIDIFTMEGDNVVKSYEFDGIKVYSGNRISLEHFLYNTSYKKILVHFVTRDMIDGIRNSMYKNQILVWIHGYETESLVRRLFNFSNLKEVNKRVVELNYKQRILMKKLFCCKDINVSFVFISEFIKNIAFEDTGVKLDKSKYSIIHNVTDTNLFKYKKKSIEQRKKILCVRPFATRNYGNDMMANCIKELSKRAVFKNLQFNIYGDGILHNDIMNEIKDFDNVNVYKKFLKQNELAELYEENGIFLCPTRWDTQGVSRCEAMACGMVAITNKVAAIPEFINNQNAIIVKEEDYIALADEVEKLYCNPDLFEELSRAGSLKIIEKTGYKETIDKELELVTSIEGGTVMQSIIKELIDEDKQKIIDENNELRDIIDRNYRICLKLRDEVDKLKIEEQTRIEDTAKLNDELLQSKTYTLELNNRYQNEIKEYLKLIREAEYHNEVIKNIYEKKIDEINNRKNTYINDLKSNYEKALKLESEKKQISINNLEEIVTSKDITIAKLKECVDEKNEMYIDIENKINKQKNNYENIINKKDKEIDEYIKEVNKLKNSIKDLSDRVYALRNSKLGKLNTKYWEIKNNLTRREE